MGGMKLFHMPSDGAMKTPPYVIETFVSCPKKLKYGVHDNTMLGQLCRLSMFFLMKERVFLVKCTSDLSKEKVSSIKC